VILASEEVADAQARDLGARLGGRVRYMLLHDKKDPPASRPRACGRLRAYRQAGLEPMTWTSSSSTTASPSRDRGDGRPRIFEPGTGGVAAEKGWTSLGGKIPQ